jgi:hypothetical protein
MAKVSGQRYQENIWQYRHPGFSCSLTTSKVNDAKQGLSMNLGFLQNIWVLPVTENATNNIAFQDLNINALSFNVEKYLDVPIE